MNANSKYEEIEEVGKYKKKSPSSKSQSKFKSKHKHEYAQVLLVEKSHPYLGTVCKQCGKIENVKFGITEKCEVGGKKVHRALSDNEIFEKYSDLERIEVDSIFQKYVPLVSVQTAEQIENEYR